MIEITIHTEKEDITFKVKEFIPYTEMGELNLFSLYAIQSKLKNFPPINEEEGETIEQYIERVGKDITEEQSLNIAESAKIGLDFTRSIDEILIISPKLNKVRTVTIMKLKKTQEYIEIMKDVMEDIYAMMNPDSVSTKKESVQKKD